MSSLPHRCPVVRRHVCYYNQCYKWDDTNKECTHENKNYFKIKGGNTKSDNSNVAVTKKPKYKELF